MKEYKIGDVVEGIVTGIESYGIFLSFDDNVTGLIHISEISDKFIRNIFEYTTMDQKINAKIIGYDKNKKQLKLSLKRIKSNKPKITETKNGFTTIKKELKTWIKQKMKEI